MSAEKKRANFEYWTRLLEIEERKDPNSAKAAWIRRKLQRMIDKGRHCAR